MNAIITSILIAACLCVAVILGMLLRSVLPAHHLNAESKDAVKLAMGLVATMTALLLGLLVSSAKDSYDTVRSEVIQMAAKITFLDRVLQAYGPEADPLRAGLRKAIEELVPQMWSDDQGASDIHSGNALYAAIQSLSPRDEVHHGVRDQVSALAIEIAQLRTLLHAQSLASVSRPLLVVVVCWLMIIFFSFSLFTPSNATATLSLLVAALSVAAAMFLILEMDRPFTGIIQIPSDPMVNALSQQL